MHGGVVSDPHVFIAIDKSGIVSIVTHRSEMGTGIRTSLPMVVADELEADWDKVRIVQAPGDEIRYGNQDTDGSRSTRHFIQPMRACGATMRLMLEMAAAAQLEGAARSGRGQEQSGRAQGLGQEARLRRTRRRSFRSANPGDRVGQAEGSQGLPLHRQGRHQDNGPSADITGREGALRPGRDDAWDEVRGRRPPAGRGWQGRKI